MTPLDVSIATALGVSVGGGVLSAFIGWAESTEPFNPRKMFVALVRGGLAGIGLSGLVIYLEGPGMIGLADYILLFLSAMGIDLAAAKGSRILKTIRDPRTA